MSTCSLPGVSALRQPHVPVASALMYAQLLTVLDYSYSSSCSSSLCGCGDVGADKVVFLAETATYPFCVAQVYFSS